MFSVIFKIILGLAIGFVISLFTSDPSLRTKVILGGVALVFVGPKIIEEITGAQAARDRQKQAEQDALNQANREEYEHQQSLRRERERLEMHAEIRARELISTLEAQYRMDAMKMEQIAKIKADFATRQQGDMNALLGQLEAMRAGGR